MSRKRKPGWSFSYRGLVVAVYLLSAAVLAPLAVRHAESEFDATLRVRQVEFEAPGGERFDLLTAVPAQLLHLANFERVELGHGDLDAVDAPDPARVEAARWRPASRNAAVVLKARRAFASLELRDVQLIQLSAPPNVRVRMAAQEADSVRMEVLGDGAQGRIGVPRTSLLALCNSCADDPAADLPSALRLTAQRAHEIAFLGARPTILSLTLGPAGAQETTLMQDVRIGPRVDFTERAGAERRSTVDGDAGAVTFPDVKVTVRIADGDMVLPGEAREMIVRSLRLDKGIELSLHGYARTLKTGPRGSEKERVPTVLEWVYAKRPGWLYFHGVTVVAVTILGFLKSVSARVGKAAAKAGS